MPEHWLKPFMTWHTRPKDDAWRHVTLAYLADMHQRVWLHCNACGHEQHADPLAFAAFHGIEENTPLLTISERLVCTACGEHKAHCWPEPYKVERGET